MANDILSGLSSIGGAVSDLFGAKGATASADSYMSAAAIAEQNAVLAKQATGIKETQTSRQIFQTIGAQKAAVGGAGFAASGTALDLLRSSASQGALSKAMIANQGAITENAYAEQAGAFKGMASASKAAATGNEIGGIIQGASGAISLYNGASKLLGGGTATGAVDTSLGIAGSSAAGDAVAATALGAGVDTSLGIAGASVAGDAVVASAVGDAAVTAAAGEGLGWWAALAACFITTAITKALGKPDDCDELQTLRSYRDNWLVSNHPMAIAEYYRVAPDIVKAIDAKPDANALWATLYEDFLVPALSEIADGNNESAYLIYRGMVDAARRMSA